MGRRQLRGVDQADPGCAETGDDVDQDLDPVGLDTGEFRALFVAAHSQDMPAGVGPLQQDRGKDSEDREDIDACGNIEPVAAEGFQADIAQAFITGDLGEGGAVGPQVRQAAADVHGAQGRDEGGHFQLGDDQAVDQADQAAEQQHQDDNGRDGKVDRLAADGQAFLDQAAGQHAYQADHGTDGQVNAACNDDEGHAQGQDAVQGHVLGDHGQGVHLKERG